MCLLLLLQSGDALSDMDDDGDDDDDDDELKPQKFRGFTEQSKHG